MPEQHDPLSEAFLVACERSVVNETADFRRLVAEVRRLRSDVVGMQAIIDLGEREVARLHGLLESRRAHTAGVMRLKEAADREANAQAGEVTRLRGLVERMLPLVNHSDRAGCPMASHRSDGEECTCGALDAVRDARRVRAGEEAGT